MSDWQIERHDDQIERLEKRLYESEEKIRSLERRPMEWLLKAELVLMGILAAAVWVVAIIDNNF
jgi:predicted RNase H-like nuclease (RuvC/YqgF family)